MSASIRIAVYALAKRVSALTTLTRASARCRVAASSRRFTVSADGSTRSRLLPTSSCKFIFATHEEDFGLPQNIRCKRALCLELRAPFTWRKHFWIDLAAERFLYGIESVDDTAEIGVT